MTLNPLPARKQQAPYHLPFAHGAAADADVTVQLAKLVVDTVIDEVQYYNATGLAEAAANFATLMLQRPLVANDVIVASIDLSADTLTSATRHGLETGDGPVRLTTTGGAPAGLATGTDYFVIRVNDFTFALATNIHNAVAGAKINITTAGTGVHTIIDQATSKRRLAWWTTDSDVSGSDVSIPAATWFSFTNNRADARDCPKGTILEFVVDEDGTTTVPAGQGMLNGRRLK